MLGVVRGRVVDGGLRSELLLRNAVERRRGGGRFQPPESNGRLLQQAARGSSDHCWRDQGSVMLDVSNERSVENFFLSLPMRAE